MPKTKEILYVFSGLLDKFLPTLANHFEHENIHPSMFVTEWIMTIFCRGFSFELVTRVWDIFIAECNFKIVYRVCLAILKCQEKEIIAASFESILAIIRDLPNNVDTFTVMVSMIFFFRFYFCFIQCYNFTQDIVWKIPLKTQHIQALQRKYELTEATFHKI